MDCVRLFSTFGGNTFTSAAGNAVFDGLENEDPIENGRVTGTYLCEQLTELAKRQSLIGDVRGSGMIAEWNWLRIAPREPLRQNGVLVGSDGRDANILKLRLCLSFQREHADRFIDALERSLDAL